MTPDHDSNPVEPRIHVCVVELAGQRGYLPLAAAYLSSYALADENIRRLAAISLVLQDTQVHPDRLLEQIVRDGVPDVLAISCQGWSVPSADVLAARLRLLNPDVLIVYGGNHVSHQGADFFHDRPFADVLVNGEGEATFRDIISRYLVGGRRCDLSDVPGVSFRGADGVVSTPDRERIDHLDEIPSPYLSGVMDEWLLDCETALLETNRGCPYRCSYCYWGQAIGQRLHMFSTERLKAEMGFLARRGIDSWYICDANFGMLPRDAELVDEIVRLRQRFGFPKTVHTNWAKNSNQRIVELCAKLNEGGVHSTYTLALQSTTTSALSLANRANMKINQIGEIARMCRSHGVVPRGELIWGLPGESYQEFLASYDDLSEYTDALSVYPLYVLPNTEYEHRADVYGIVTKKAEPDTDYAYCVQHARMTSDEFHAGLRFIISNNILKVGGVFFRLYPRIARQVAGIPFHRTVGGLAQWVMESEHPVADRFRRYYATPVELHRQSLTEVWLAIRRDRDGLVDMIEDYVESSLHADIVDPEVRHILREAFRFDVLTYPIVDTERMEEQEGVEGRYIRTVEFEYDFLGAKLGDELGIRRGRFRYTTEHRSGLWRYPMENWYFGLIGYQAEVRHAHRDVAAALS